MGVMKKIERKLSKNKTKQNKQMVIKQTFDDFEFFFMRQFHL